MSQENAGFSEVRIETVIQAPREKVWKALTAEIGRWWPDEFYTGGDSGKREYLLEPNPGGRMFEDWGDGNGLLWGTVHTVQAPETLYVTGHSFPQWGGPTVLMIGWTLTEEGDGTRLVFVESALGRVTDEHTQSREKGWGFLFDRALKAFAEGAEPPVWEDGPCED